MEYVHLSSIDPSMEVNGVVMRRTVLWSRNWDAMVSLMNEDIREDIHRSAPTDKWEFWSAYAKADPDGALAIWLG